MAIQFKPKLGPTVASLIVLPILISLGFWQLDRAEFKQQQLENFKQRSNQPATVLKPVDNLQSIKAADSLYKNYEVSGHYDAAHSFLIDNRVHNSQVGFYVVTPLVISGSNKIMLVNRGWIKGNRYRSDLPGFETPTEKITIKGIGYVPIKNFFVPDDVKITTKEFPAVIQAIDFAAIKNILGADVYPFILRLAPQQKSGFIRDWKVINSSPEKSQSYAAQWFTMALVVLLIYLNSCIKFKQESAA